MWNRYGNKFNNVKTKLDGYTFDSKKEAAYYQQLKLLKQAGKIHNFCPQPSFELQPAFVDKDGTHIRAITYKADFIVFHDGYTEIVDVKGIQTEVFKMKWKILKFKCREKGYKFTIA